MLYTENITYHLKEHIMSYLKCLYRSVVNMNMMLLVISHSHEINHNYTKFLQMISF